MEGAVLCAANHAPLTPISFLERSALVYPDRPAVVSAGAGAAPPRTWRETRDRCLRLAAALAGLGVQRRDVVAVFAQNIPAMCELHFAVPMAGAVICALNSRLDAPRCTAGAGGLMRAAALPRADSSGAWRPAHLPGSITPPAERSEQPQPAPLET